MREKMVISGFVGLFLLSLCSGSAMAQILACDPQAGVTKYEISGSWAEGSVVFGALVDGSFRYNLSSLPPGSYTGKVRAGKNWVLNGQVQPATVWGDYAPFDLTVPDIPAISSGLIVRNSAK